MINPSPIHPCTGQSFFICDLRFIIVPSCLVRSDPSASLRTKGLVEEHYFVLRQTSFDKLRMNGGLSDYFFNVHNLGSPVFDQQSPTRLRW